MVTMATTVYVMRMVSTTTNTLRITMIMAVHTLWKYTSDGYGGYDQVLAQERRIGAGCLAHARRKFYELVKDNLSPVGTQAIQRIAALYKIEREIKDFSVEDRHAGRQSSAKPLCNT